MKYYIIPDTEALSHCAACQGNIDELSEVFSLGAKLKPDVDVSKFERHCIQIDLVSEEKPVYAMITAQGSEAKNAGNDCMFLVCSESCGKKLKAILQKEISVGKLFETVQDEIT